MPPVRTLTSNYPTPTAAPATVAPAAGSLATLPAWAREPAIPDVPSNGAPYIGSASTRSAKWDAQRAAGCADGDYYLEDRGQFQKLAPVRYWLASVAAFRTLMDAQGDVVAVTRDMNDRAKDEHFVCIVIVDAGGTLTPAKWDARKTKSGSITPMLTGLKLASDPGFAGLSDAHRVAAAFPVPFGRVVGVATVARKVARGSGNVYYAGTATVSPTPLADLTRLQEALQDPEFLKKLDAVKASYDARVKQLDSMCR